MWTSPARRGNDLMQVSLTGRLDMQCNLQAAAVGIKRVKGKSSVRPFPAQVPKLVYCSQRTRAQRKLFITSRAQEVSSTASAEERSRDPSVYFEPFLRSFILGASAGAAFECLHVVSKLLSLVNEVGYGALPQVLPSMGDHFAPLIVNDHLIAVTCWLVFYIVEACAVLTVLEKHRQNPAAAAYALRGLSTLPKRMLPRLQPFKDFLGALGLKLGTTLQPLTAAASSSLLESPQSAFVTAPPPVRPRKHLLPAPPMSDPRQEPEGPGVIDTGGSLKEKRARQGLKPGQLDIVTQGLLHRQRELTHRRSYLKNFWYAAGISEQVQDKPVGVEILGEKVVLFRDINGKINCLNNVCPHRGAPLHKGWVSPVGEHECIVCPYHGWAFDKDGVLRDVPAAENADEWPKKPLVEAYPVEEKGGFIWLFYGSKDLPKDERPPIPYVPELEDPKWRAVYGEIEFDCSHWGVFENAIDMAHIHYLHADSFGNEDKPQIKAMTCKSDAYGISAEFALHNKPVNALWNFSKVNEVKVSAQALLPSTSVIGFTLGAGLSFITFVNTVPISANRTINRFALIRRLDVDQVGSFVFNMPVWDKFAREAMIKILTQDKAMVENLLPETLGREISVKADLPQIAYRKLRQEYIAMGYGVDPEAGALSSQTRDM